LEAFAQDLLPVDCEQNVSCAGGEFYNGEGLNTKLEPNAPNAQYLF
jgi:hypothetical protein